MEDQGTDNTRETPEPIHVTEKATLFNTQPEKSFKPSNNCYMPLIWRTDSLSPPHLDKPILWKLVAPFQEPVMQKQMNQTCPSIKPGAAKLKTQIGLVLRRGAARR